MWYFISDIGVCCNGKSPSLLEAFQSWHKQARVVDKMVITHIKCLQEALGLTFHVPETGASGMRKVCYPEEDPVYFKK